MMFHWWGFMHFPMTWIFTPKSSLAWTFFPRWYLTFLSLYFEWQYNKKTFQLSLLSFIILSVIFFSPNPPLSVMVDTSSIPEVREGPVPPPCLISWMSTVRGNLSYEEHILRRVRGILNKLTVEKYTLLRNQLIDSGITTPHILLGVAFLIHNKALAEPMFLPLYAFLCHELCCRWLLDPPDGLPSFPSLVGEEFTFQRILVKKCQQASELENIKVAETRQLIVTGVSLGDRYKERRRNLGEIQFMCELMKQRYPAVRGYHLCD